MKINEITVSYGRTLQIKQFEPMTFHFSAKAELSEKDNIDEAYTELKKIVKEQLGQEIVQWENPQMVLRRMQQQGADDYVEKKEDVPFKNNHFEDDGHGTYGMEGIDAAK